MQGPIKMICLVVLLTVVVSAVDSFSRGAPLSQCGFMTPKHGFQPQPHPPNANITYRVLDKGSQAKQITVTLSSQSGQFRGYILRAEDPASTLKEGVGTWWLNDSSISSPNQYLHCHGKLQTAITHTRNAFFRQSVTAIWRPPADFNGTRIIFRATVVEDFKTFWKNVVSQPLQLQPEFFSLTTMIEIVQLYRPASNPSEVSPSPSQQITRKPRQQRPTGSRDDDKINFRLGSLRNSVRSSRTQWEVARCLCLLMSLIRGLEK